MRKRVHWLPVMLLLAILFTGWLPGATLTTEVSAQAGTDQVLRIVNPVGDPAAALKAPAPRLTTLEGKRIGVYIARRANAFELMGRVAENLARDYKAVVLGGKEGTLWAKKTYDREGDIAALIAEKPDAIVMGLSS